MERSKMQYHVHIIFLLQLTGCCLSKGADDFTVYPKWSSVIVNTNTGSSENVLPDITVGEQKKSNKTSLNHPKEFFYKNFKGDVKEPNNMFININEDQPLDKEDQQKELVEAVEQYTIKRNTKEGDVQVLGKSSLSEILKPTEIEEQLNVTELVAASESTVRKERGVYGGGQTGGLYGHEGLDKHSSLGHKGHQHYGHGSHDGYKDHGSYGKGTYGYGEDHGKKHGYSKGYTKEYEHKYDHQYGHEHGNNHKHGQHHHQGHNQGHNRHNYGQNYGDHLGYGNYGRYGNGGYQIYGINPGYGGYGHGGYGHGGYGQGGYGQGGYGHGGYGQGGYGHRGLRGYNGIYGLGGGLGYGIGGLGYGIGGLGGGLGNGVGGIGYNFGGGLGHGIGGGLMGLGFGGGGFGGGYGIPYGLHNGYRGWGYRW